MARGTRSIPSKETENAAILWDDAAKTYWAWMPKGQRTVSSMQIPQSLQGKAFELRPRDGGPPVPVSTAPLKRDPDWLRIIEEAYGDVIRAINAPV